MVFADSEISIDVCLHFLIHDCLEFLSILFCIHLNLCFIFLLLWIVDRELSHEKVARVLSLSTFIEAKVLSDLKSWTLVSDKAISKQDKAIAVGEGLRAGLMNRCNNCLVLFPGQLGESSAYPLGGKTIQARRRLVEKYDLRVGNQFNTDSCPFSFASGDGLLDH